MDSSHPDLLQYAILSIIEIRVAALIYMMGDGDVVCDLLYLCCDRGQNLLFHV